MLFWPQCAIALIGGSCHVHLPSLLPCCTTDESLIQETVRVVRVQPAPHCWVAVLQPDGMDADGTLEEQAMLEPLDVGITVRDGGMALLTTLTPDFRWQSGSADITLRCIHCKSKG